MTITNISPNRLAIMVLFIFFVARLWVSSGFDLSADEAHYALYAQFLDWSYFDHPPLVGWLQHLMLYFGNDESILRLLPNIFHGLTGLSLLWLATLLYPQARSGYIGLVSVLLFESSILLQLMGIAWLPDVPLALFTLLSIIAFIKAQQSSSWQQWLLFGLTIGLMGLSKYTAILFALGYGLWIVFYDRKILLKPFFWLAIVLALLMIVPVIYWNVAHDWISLNYQLQHGEVNSNTIDWLALGEAQAVHVLAYSPLLIGLSFIVIGSYAWRCWQLTGFTKESEFQREKITHDTNTLTDTNNEKKSTANYQTLLLSLAIPYLVVFAIVSSKGGHYLPHWISVATIVLCPLMAEKLLDYWKILWFKISFIALLLMTISLPIILTIIMQGIGDNPQNQLKREVLKGITGWRETAYAASSYMKIYPQAKAIYVSNWSEASRIAWYAYPHKIIPIDGRYDQFDLWYDADQKLLRQATPGLLIETPANDQIEQAKGHFNQCKQIQRRNYFRMQEKFSFVIWLCQ